MNEPNFSKMKFQGFGPVWEDGEITGSAEVYEDSDGKFWLSKLPDHERKGPLGPRELVYLLLGKNER